MRRTSALLLFVALCQGLNNGLGQRPQMGFNSWNYYYCNVNEGHISTAIDQMVQFGLLDLGYEYVVIDDCWAANDRDANGKLVPDPKTFPHGIKALADKAHIVGLKFGIYSSAGTRTCAGRPASLGHEKDDADTFASWGIDYLKYDNCNKGDAPAKKRYGDMRDALLATGRPIFYSMCSWGTEGVAEWGSEYGNSWRTTDDIFYGVDDITYNAVANDVGAEHAGPGGWNDPDMLRVGNGQTIGLDRINFGVWAVVKAPLILSCDMQKLSQEQLSIIRNKEVIALNQDSLGRQGRLIYNAPLDYEIWAVQQHNGTWGVAVVNLQKNARTLDLQFNLLGFLPKAVLAVRRLWQGVEMGTFSEKVTLKIAAEDCELIRLTPQFDFKDKTFRIVPKGLPGQMRPTRSGEQVNDTIGTWSWSDDDSAKWKVVDVGNGWFNLQEQKKGLYLGIAEDGRYATALKTPGDSAMWKMTLAPAANHYIVQNKGGLVLDSLNCKTWGEAPTGFAGGTVGVYSRIDSDCQYWSFTEIAKGQGK